MELDEFKRTEMIIHDESRRNTLYYYYYYLYYHTWLMVCIKSVGGGSVRYGTFD